MPSTAPEQEIFKVKNIELIHDDENRFPPVPVAAIEVDGELHHVTLDAVTMQVDIDTFDNSGLSYDDVDDINDAIDGFRTDLEIEPALTQSSIEGLVADLAKKTGDEYKFSHFSGDQYELRKVDEDTNAWALENTYNSLNEAFQSIQEKLSAAPDLDLPEPIRIDSEHVDLDRYAGSVVGHVQTYPAESGTLPAAEAFLTTWKHDMTLQLDPETLRVDVSSSHIPNFDLDDKALARIHGEIDQLIEAGDLTPPVNEQTVAAIADGLKSLTGQQHDFRQAGEQYELRKQGENGEWEQVKQYENLSEAFLDVARREEIAMAGISNPAEAQALHAMLDQVDKNHAQAVSATQRQADPSAPVEPIDLLNAGHSNLNPGISVMRQAMSELPMGKAHGPDGQTISQSTPAAVIKQLDDEEQELAVAVKR